MKTHLHFTFGPVQSFVAQARRTRDFYTGSFLLSHLALAAMTAARDAGGVVILPSLTAIEKLADTTEHAVAPNRFIAEFTGLDTAASAARKAAATLYEKWKRIADQVWQRFLSPVAAQDHGTRDILERQIPNFWEIAWAVGDVQETDLLDRRKNWRTPRATVEPGDHCTLMGQWQELSGFIRSQQKQQQDDFWEAVRAQVKAAGGSELDLEKDERLCAIAFVKRCFPLVAKEAIDRDLGMENWPSTVSIAAVPWLRKIKTANAEVLHRCKAYAGHVREQPGARVSSARRIRALRDFPAEAGEFPSLSGNFLNRTALANERGTPLKDPSKERRDFLRSELRKLEEASGDRAGSFYALLLMDGDSMGRLIHEHRNELQKVTHALTTFSERAPGIVDDHDGICVYAGGDDLLAMLPLDEALKAAIVAHDAYRMAFHARGITGGNGTISAGLVFAHYRCAFSRVLGYAHELLDDVAKAVDGKDALALGVLKPGGGACQWCAKFETLIADSPHCFKPLIDAYKKEGEGKVGSLSSSFLYNLRERFADLLGEEADGAQASDGIPFDRDTLRKLLVAEYVHDKIEKQETAKAERQRKEAERLITQLLKVCEQPDGRFSLDGARLVKFLALDGKEGAE